MGALRAAELSPFGMRGYGLIYRWYRAVPFANDDEVAVAMTPSELGAQALSEALINMRLTLRRGERAGLMPSDMRHKLEDLARSILFVHRTYQGLFDAGAICSARSLGSLDRPAAALGCRPCGRPEAGGRRRPAALLGRRAGACDAQAGSEAAPFRMTEAWAADLEAAGLYSEDLLKN